MARPEILASNALEYSGKSSDSAREVLSQQLAVKLIRPFEGSKSVEQNISQIEWQTDVKSAFTRAQAEGKPLVVVFQEDRCGWCKLFGQELEKSSTSAIAKDAIFLRVTPSNNADGKKLAELCNIEGYPSVSVLTVKGGNITPVFKVSGFLESPKFVASMQRVFAQLDKPAVVA